MKVQCNWRHTLPSGIYGVDTAGSPILCERVFRTDVLFAFSLAVTKHAVVTILIILIPLTPRR
jgi:hypothetical protein